MEKSQDNRPRLRTKFREHMKFVSSIFLNGYCIKNNEFELLLFYIQTCYKKKLQFLVSLTGTCISFFSFSGIFVYILTRVLSRSEYLCSKKNHSMKTIMSYQEFLLSGRTNMFYLQYHPYLIHRRHLLWSPSFIKVQNSSIFQRM